MENLKSILTASLRKGDLFTPWNEGQYAVLLPGATRKQAEAILERAGRNFNRHHVREELLLNTGIHPLLPFDRL